MLLDSLRLTAWDQPHLFASRERSMTNTHHQAPAVVDKPTTLNKTKSGRVAKTTAKPAAKKAAAPKKAAATKKATPKKAAAPAA